MLYDVLYVAALIVLWPVFLWKIIRGKYREALRARWGNTPERPALAPPRKRIWVHAVSVGEALAARTLVDILSVERPEWEVVVSTITETGQAVARRSFGAERVFYCPFDFSWTVRRTFDKIRPSALALMELELWPNLVREAGRRGVPVAVLNGRITERSFRGYRRFGALFRGTLGSVSAFAVQTEEYASRMRALGVPDERVTVAGSVKYDAVRTDAPAAAGEEARKELGLAAGDTVVLGGSTHPGEEDALLDAARKLAADFERLSLVLAPRHPERLDSVERACRERGFATVRKTALARGEPRPPGAVVLVDTMGELSRLYAAADAVFVGGSLIPHGGQNVMEPAGAGKPCVFGPNMWNFEDAASELVEAGGARRIGGAGELAEALGAMLADPAAARRMGEAARGCIEARKGATRRNYEVLRGLLENAT